VILQEIAIINYFCGHAQSIASTPAPNKTISPKAEFPPNRAAAPVKGAVGCGGLTLPMIVELAGGGIAPEATDGDSAGGVTAAPDSDKVGAIGAIVMVLATPTTGTPAEVSVALQLGCGTGKLVAVGIT